MRSCAVWVALAGVAAAGCKKDACLDAPAQAQIDVQLQGLDPSGVTRVDVTLTVNGATLKHTFPRATPSFVFEFKDQDRDPRSIAILADAYDSAGKQVGTGSTGDRKFTADACNFLTVSVRPGGRDGGLQPDLGPDGLKPDGLVARCDDGKVDPGEECDGSTGGKDCAALGCQGGQLSCDANCRFDKSKCTMCTCGNGVINGSEDCDKTNLNGKSCAAFGFTGSGLACKSDCTFDKSGCCGDGTLGGGELCDGFAVGTGTCVKEGFDGGVLKCTADCKSFDTSGCYKCGDGIRNGSEQCDKLDLNGKSCKDQGYDGGTLACKVNCTFDVAACYKCGDGVKNGPNEQCDGSDFGGKTCVALGFGGGVPACSTDCKLWGCTTASYVSVAAGTFTMGSPAAEPCRQANEDLHQVTLTRAFEMSDHETTQGEFQALMGYNPTTQPSGLACGKTCPVEELTWHEAAAYCNTLSTLRGLTPCYACSGSGKSVSCLEAFAGAAIYGCRGYRLPTDAEWEYAYRAGTTQPYYNGSNDGAKCTSCSDAQADKIAWYYCNSGNSTHGVKLLKLPNAWQLYDMAGNVWEWCHDEWQSNLGTAPVIDPVGSGSLAHRVMRGGDWSSMPNFLRGASRAYYSSIGGEDDFFGVRCVRTLKP